MRYKTGKRRAKKRGSVLRFLKESEGMMTLEVSVIIPIFFFLTGGLLFFQLFMMDMAAAKAAFSDYLDSTQLDSRQIYFVNQIVEYIVHNGLMKDMSVLQEPPFTDQGSIVDVFTDLSVWMGIRKVIDQVNANALAA